MAAPLHTLASAVVASQARWRRKPADFYPTPAEVTAALIAFLGMVPGTRILEPACGDGSMAAVLKMAGMDVEASDIRFSGYGRPHVDFLDRGYEPRRKPEWVITNPPFSLSSRFIERALDVAPRVAMLLKATYWHAASRLPLFHRHPPLWHLPLTWRPAFLEHERGKSPIMEVMWVIWERGHRGYPMTVPLERPHNVTEPVCNIERLLRSSLMLN